MRRGWARCGLRKARDERAGVLGRLLEPNVRAKRVPRPARDCTAGCGFNGPSGCNGCKSEPNFDVNFDCFFDGLFGDFGTHFGLILVSFLAHFCIFWYPFPVHEKSHKKCRKLVPLVLDFSNMAAEGC